MTLNHNAVRSGIALMSPAMVSVDFWITTGPLMPTLIDGTVNCFDLRPQR